MIGRKKKNHRTIIIVIIATIAILVTRKAGDRGRDSEDSLVPKEKKFLAFFFVQPRGRNSCRSGRLARKFYCKKKNVTPIRHTTLNFNPRAITRVRYRLYAIESFRGMIARNLDRGISSHTHTPCIHTRISNARQKRAGERTRDDNNAPNKISLPPNDTSFGTTEIC